jgi:type IV secretory pathway TraG/TraD family ATPase VirD4
VDKNDWERINQVVPLVLTTPFIFIGINFLWPLFGVENMDGIIPDPDVVNHHFMGPWIMVFALPYVLGFFFRRSENIFLQTKLAVCPAMAVSILDFLFPYYNNPYFVSVVVLTGVGLFGLFWKPVKKRHADYGKYPLLIAPKGTKGRGFPTSSLHENVQIVGGTGTGKTHYVIKPFIEQTVRQGLGCFISDVKGNMLRDVAFYVNQASDRTLYHFTLADTRHSHSYNPLYGNNADAIANRVFTALYSNTKNTETYYVELADAFLHNLIGLLKEEIDTITFQDLLLATQEADTFKIIGSYCLRHPHSSYAWYFRDQWLSKPPKDRRMELTGLVNKLQRFCNNEWAYLVNVRKPDIRMADVVARGEVFLFSPNFARYPEDAKALSILAMMDLSEQLADRYMEPPEKPFRVFLDEFYNLAYPRFIDFINKCREAQVNLFLAHQSLGDLKGVSPEFQEQVMNTASNKIILRVNDPDTAESFARQFGTELDQEARVTSYKADHTVAGYSVPITEKFRFHPNRIKELKTGQAIVKIVADGRVYVFQSDLQAATTAPQEFYPERAMAPKEYRERENESSVHIPVETKEPVKAGNRMGEDDNA